MQEDWEVKEAEIIRTVYSGSYAHAENVLHLLTSYNRSMSYEEAIDRLHHEIVIGDQ